MLYTSDAIRKHCSTISKAWVSIDPSQSTFESNKVLRLACPLHGIQQADPCKRRPRLQRRSQSSRCLEIRSHTTVTTTRNMSSIPTGAEEKKDEGKALPGGKKIINGIVYDADGKP